MGELFDGTRSELECSNAILSVTLHEGLALCEQGHYDLAADQAAVFGDLFDRVAERLRVVIRAVADYGSHFPTLPNVMPLSAANFRGSTSQRTSMMSGLLAKVVFRTRTRFFHKLQSLLDIVEDLQQQAHEIIDAAFEPGGSSRGRAWRQLEVLGYDLNTCTSETTVILKSFFCSLPGEELESFRQRLLADTPKQFKVRSSMIQPSQRK
jgi:hypothetical protein